MGQKRTPIEKIGKKERGLIASVQHALKNYTIFKEQKKQTETAFNMRIIDHLRQKPYELPFLSKNIPSSELCTHVFRPEGYLLNAQGHPLVTIECKRLIDDTAKTAKTRFKEGLGQSFIYRIKYKYVFFVLLDFTKEQHFVHSFGRGNTPSSAFSSWLRTENNIEIVSIPCKDVGK
jgi:hypothetical protein